MDALQELDRAIEEVVLEPFFTLEERNELFLDLAENYRKAGLYQSYLEPAAGLAEAFEKNCAEAEEHQTEIMEEKWKRFEKDMQQYEALFRNFLVGEFYADCLIPEGSLTDMVIKIQWIAMEYAVIRQVLFLQWQKEEKMSYETIRDDIVVICRMMGYEEEDIQEYLENSFESLIWDWGYFALIIGKNQVTGTTAGSEM